MPSEPEFRVTQRVLGAHTHTMVEIDVQRDAQPGTFRVTRWCSECGAIVIDLDVDNATRTGAIRRMQFPQSAYRPECLPS